ncbi:DAK2 domain-containing protein [Thermopolyspora sp. NPDC052614]|uniref:DAK2 domain-containing protein n=1 Tax=Thermopolyspora sp. NPDC052614 TaxID=3155682 RepID=UPI003441DD69
MTAHAIEEMDDAVVRRWCRVCAESLGEVRTEIDALNVFPVPDGDTGTNLHLTMLSAVEALDALPEDAGTEKTWQALAHGTLLGARGNSGVIVSQAFRGLAEVLKRGRGRADDLRRALEHAAETARVAVMRPVEGTVLSVLDAAAAAARRTTGGLADVATRAAEAARRALERTPEQLEVLARNGVVDAGGAGLTVILESLAAVITDSYVQRHHVPAPRGRTEVTGYATGHAHAAAGHGVLEYEVMYLLDADDAAVATLRAELDRLGESLVITGGDGLWNVHVHLADAGAAIEAGIAAGRPHRIRVTYLGPADTPATPAAAEQGQAPAQGRGVVAVAAGAGIARLFERSGAVVVRREPGSSPPLSQVLEAIRRAGAEVAVLPNDGGVASVASAAAQVAREEGIAVSVIPTRATVQGVAALAVHDPLRRFDDDVVAMTDAAGHTRHGHVWVANREAVTSAGVCRPGDVLGVVDGDVALIGSDLAETAVAVADRMLSGSSELVTLVSGTGDGERLAETVRAHLAATRPDIDVTVYEGGQGGYPLLIGVE